MRCQKLWVIATLLRLRSTFCMVTPPPRSFSRPLWKVTHSPMSSITEKSSRRAVNVGRRSSGILTLKSWKSWMSRFSTFYLHLASVDELQEPGGILDGDVRQEQHLVAPVLLLEQPLQRLDIKLKFLFTSRSCSPGGTWRRRQQRSSERAGRRSRGRWGSGHSSWESKD